MLTGHIPELLMVLVAGLIFFGPKRLPEMGSALGQGIRDFKKGVSGLAETVDAHHTAERNEAKLATVAVPVHEGDTVHTVTPADGHNQHTL